MRSGSADETEKIGERIAGELSSGTVVALYGNIGAGKTCLIKGIIRGLGCSDLVTSPTYTIVHEYTVINQNSHKSFPLYHIDAYRLNNDEDFENTGAMELLSNGGIALIEWSERIPRSLPSTAISITIHITGAYDRVIQISGIEALHEHI